VARALMIEQGTKNSQKLVAGGKNRERHFRAEPQT
jgi:hypothetical protein